MNSGPKSPFPVLLLVVAALISAASMTALVVGGDANSVQVLAAG
jgi:hypothetical protein